VLVCATLTHREGQGRDEWGTRRFGVEVKANAPWRRAGGASHGIGRLCRESQMPLDCDFRGDRNIV